MNYTKPAIYSIGHGTRSLETFLGLLYSLKIRRLADIRSYPTSKRNPQFNRKILHPALEKAGISYTWFPDLGGFRKKGLGGKSPHLALASPGLRNYADHMGTASFLAAVESLCSLAQIETTCFMCAETLPQRCHRLLLADCLWTRGFQVIHIIDSQRTTVHQLSRLAAVRNGSITYDRSEPRQLELTQPCPK